MLPPPLLRSLHRALAAIFDDSGWKRYFARLLLRREPPPIPPPIADPQERDSSTRVVLECMERVEGFRKEGGGWLMTAGNLWEFPPAAVVASGLESIRKYFDTWEQCDFSLVEIHALKIVFVGAYGAGKTR